MRDETRDEGRGSGGGVAGVGLSLDHAADTLAELGPALDLFETLGLDSVEAFLPAFGVILGGRVRPPALAEMTAICADRPFAITLHGPLNLNLGDWRRATLHGDLARRLIDVAAAVGAPLVVVHGAIAPADDAEEVARTRAAEIEGLTALAPHAVAAGVTVAVETVFCDRGEWTASPAELAEQLAAVGCARIGATLDFSHALINATLRGFDFMGAMAALAPFARHLHIHDSFGQPPAFRTWSHGDAMTFGFGDLHLPPGSGAVPWEALTALGYGGPSVANLELNKRWAAEWPEAIAWTRDWVARVDAARAVAGG